MPTAKFVTVATIPVFEAVTVGRTVVEVTLCFR